MNKRRIKSSVKPIINSSKCKIDLNVNSKITLNQTLKSLKIINTPSTKRGDALIKAKNEINNSKIIKVDGSQTKFRDDSSRILDCNKTKLDKKTEITLVNSIINLNSSKSRNVSLKVEPKNISADNICNKVFSSLQNQGKTKTDLPKSTISKVSIILQKVKIACNI